LPPRFDPSALRRAIDNYNSAVRRYNTEVQRQRARTRQAIETYNREVRVHNARVEANRRRLRTALQNLGSSRVVVHTTTYYQSVTSLHQAYEWVEETAEGTWLRGREDILDQAQQETRNSVELAQALDAPPPGPPALPAIDRAVEMALIGFDPELAARWRGAVFSISPSNPDAARHFSASAREILTEIVERRVSDRDVLAMYPGAPRNRDGRPTRRARIAYSLVRAGRASDALAAFADADLANVIELFGLFNIGTHERAGYYDLRHLDLIRRRVEEAVTFLHSILL
jgi:Predicted pPIWI-associating nuclease